MRSFHFTRMSRWSSNSRTAHGPCRSHVLPVRVPSDDIVSQMPMSRALVHPRCLVTYTQNTVDFFIILWRRYILAVTQLLTLISCRKISKKMGNLSRLSSLIGNASLTSGLYVHAVVFCLVFSSKRHNIPYNISVQYFFISVLSV